MNWLLLMGVVSHATFMGCASLENERSSVDVAEAIIEYLESLAEQSAAMCSEFRVVGPFVIDAPNIRQQWPADLPDVLPEESSHGFAWCHVDGRTRIERRDEVSGSETTWLWNGSKWYTQIKNAPSPPTHQLRIAAYSQRDVGGIPFLDVWNGCVDHRAGVSTGRLADTLRDSEVVTTVRSDATVRARFRVPSRGLRWEVEVICDVTDDFQLREVVVDAYDSRDGTHVSRAQFVIDEWADFDGIRMPSRAHVWTCMFEMSSRIERGLGPVANYIEFERVSATVMDRDDVRPEQFEPDEPLPGTWIYDSTLRISYTLGRSSIIVDGKRLMLSEPIDELITDNLPEILQTSRDKASER